MIAKAWEVLVNYRLQLVMRYVMRTAASGTIKSSSYFLDPG